MLTFLSGILRDEGGYDFKRAVVEAIFDLVKYITDSRDTGMLGMNAFSATALYL
jgi:coatomer protein complex subunit gamma